jgi:hypothetical protein
MIYKKYSSCEYETLDDLIKDYVEYLIWLNILKQK